MIGGYNILYDSNAASILLGALFNSPDIMLDDNFPLTKEDFYNKETKDGSRFHQIMFVVAQQLMANGVTEIKGVDIGEFLQKYPKQLEIAEDNEYLDFTETVKQLGDKDNFEYYYNVVRKYSILRTCRDYGFDISDIYDEDDERCLDGLRLEDITNFFEGRLATICKKYHTTKRLTEYRAGENFDRNKEKFKEEPLMGVSFQSPYFNSIFRGLYGFGLRSANEGFGKTSLAVGDLCKSCVTEYYDSETQQWVKNKSRAGNGLFINTEMSLEDELEPIFIAWIADVPRSHILDGEYENDEEQRVEYAGKVLKESCIYLVDDPDFTIKSLTTTIADYAINKNVKTVVFDYVANNTFLQAEISSQTKVPQREDMILLALTDRLKQASRKYGVHLLSGTQLNSKGTDVNNKFVDASWLMGGKNQARKCDFCMIMMTPTKEELEQTEMLCMRNGFNNIKPNVVTHIAKGRANKYPKNIKVFQYVDLGTGRSTDLYCTTRDNQPIKVKKLYIGED